jgi:hypothetical protein
MIGIMDAKNLTLLKKEKGCYILSMWSMQCFLHKKLDSNLSNMQQVQHKNSPTTSFVFNLTNNHWCMMESMKKWIERIDRPNLQTHMWKVGTSCKEVMSTSTIKCWSSGMGLGRIDKLQLFTQTCTNPTRGDQCIIIALLVLGRAMGNFGLTRLTTAWTWGKPPPSPL